MSKSSESDLKNEINELSKTIDTILKNIESEREKLSFIDSNNNEKGIQNEKSTNHSNLERRSPDLKSSVI